MLMRSLPTRPEGSVRVCSAGSLTSFGNEWKNKRLLIVAGGVLEYLPFAALPLPSGGQPLIADHEVVNLPSASVLAAIRREAEGRQGRGKRGGCSG